MAQNTSKNSITTVSTGLAFKRSNPYPIDETSYFASLQSAQTYAASDPTAYVGQVLTVVVGGSAKLYIITSSSGTLVEVPDMNAVAAAISAASVDVVGFKGALFNGDMELLPDPSEMLPGYEYLPGLEISDSNLEGLPVWTTVETGDYMVMTHAFDTEEESYAAIVGYFEDKTPLPEWGSDDLNYLLEHFVILQQNLTGALIAALKNGSGAVLTSVTTQDGQVVFGSGNVKTGVQAQRTLTAAEVSALVTAATHTVSVGSAAQPYVAGSAQVYVNGLLLSGVAESVSAGVATLTIPFTTGYEVMADDDVLVAWQYTANAQVA